MKIVGIVLVMCSCAAVGFASALRLFESCRLWEAWLVFLERLYNDLRYSVRPLQELLERVDRRGLDALAWLSEFRGQKELTCPCNLCSEERAFAQSFFGGLGLTDLEGQLYHIECHIQKVHGELSEAQSRCRSRAKAWIVTGICAGLCLGCLFW